MDDRKKIFLSFMAVFISVVWGAGPPATTIPGPDWFPFRASAEKASSIIGLEGWLEKPAGRRGGVRLEGDRFQFEDGTPVKFWGTNLSYASGCAPPKDVASATAARFAHYGINGVRLHKFSYSKLRNGIADANDTTRMDSEGLDRFDYLIAELKKQGVYAGWSHTFGFEVGPGNRGRLLAYDEIAKNLGGNTYALINFAEDVQDLMIDMIVNLLKHRNPYTGIAYFEEPALSFIEFQNEDDIFFFTSATALNACPTYKKEFMRRFADWLKLRYGTLDELAKAWPGALQSVENFADATIVPNTNPWFFSDDYLPRQTGGERQRLLDTAMFLHEAQNKFYSKFERAVRIAGYRGPLVGSSWQAPPMLPHYYNLRSDYLVGVIDRHNYFGGKLHDSMLSRPGSGYFSSGLQQVIDRPFALSEWIHVYPSLYSAEGPAIIAAYGMGLQGWDASYEFQSRAMKQAFRETVGWIPLGVWEADVPTQVGQYPTLARMIYRGDVKEGEVVSIQRVSIEELKDGRISEKVTQYGEMKQELLAAGKVVVEFTEQPQPSKCTDPKQFSSGTALISNTGQLIWETAGKGYFTVNTPGTKGVVGFAQGQELKLGNVTVVPNSPYASIFLTALEKEENLDNALRGLLSVVARNCNTGFKYLEKDDSVLNNGEEPILMEPVKAVIKILGRPVAAIHVLDHDGHRTGRILPVQDGQFTINGALDRALYYEVVWQAR
jgi:hypothetical protein